ncbi:MAG: lasso peptide isopeptide bond-forming cyclase [Methanobacterium sp.]|nr:lasso peptide isopeptide bond-forming cyclase [Methanobacterium sp.]
MSAITGIFYRDGRKVDPELIKKMNDRLSHRGPDGSDTWCEGSVALGHQMLWTTPESLHEKLPFEESGLVITADARIDNRKELSKELDIEDKEDVSDSYFILKSYEKWGEKCPEHLLGDFAFAIWDKNKEKLFCARDHMGVKPFYYYLDDEMFVFGTEIKALFCVQGVPNQVNDLKVAFHLMTVITDKKFTFYDGIYSLTAANSLIINPDSDKKKNYWELNFDSKIFMESDDEYIKAFQKIFTDAIKCRMRSAYPLGFELSGGLDSSSVVCMAKKILTENDYGFTRINTFSMVFDDFPQVDERDYIKEVLNIGNINNNFTSGDKINPFENFETILWHQDQPFFTPNIAILWDMYKKMEKNKIRVLLGGSGGDEIVSHGNNYIRELALSLQLKKLMREIRGSSEHSKKSISKLFYYEVFLFLIPYKIKNFGKKLNSIFKVKSNENSILNIDFENKLGGIDYLKSFKASLILSKTKTARQYHYFVINRISHQYTMEMQDRIASAYQIEPRYPFFDKRLVEFCYSIPNNMKYRYGWDRYIQRIALNDILPRKIQWRPSKKLFGPVLERNLLFEKDLLVEIFYENNEVINDYVNLDIIKDQYYKYSSTTEEKSLKDIWQITYNIWLVAFLYLWLKCNYNQIKS